MPIADPAKRRAYHRAWHARRLAGLAWLELCTACGQNARDGNTTRKPPAGACVIAELEPAYCQIIVDRWEAFTGKTASRAKRSGK